MVPLLGSGSLLPGLPDLGTNTKKVFTRLYTAGRAGRKDWETAMISGISIELQSRRGTIRSCVIFPQSI